MKFYLITGFLGAGKTTLLKELIDKWSDKDLAVIVNEFGKEGVDGPLLQSKGMYTEEINNGSIFCTCKIHRFEEVLERIIKRRPEIIVAEASGLSDPTSIHQIIGQEGKYNDIEYMGSICLIDAKRFEKVIHTARVSKKQLRISDLAIINKIDQVDEEKLEQVKAEVLNQQPVIEIKETQFGKIELEWLEGMKEKTLEKKELGIHTRDIGLQKFLITIDPICTYQELIKMMELFIEETYRIKGFVNLAGDNYFVDCVGDYISVKPCGDEYEVNNKLVVLSGPSMPTLKSINKAREWYCKQIVEVEK